MPRQAPPPTENRDDLEIKRVNNGYIVRPLHAGVDAYVTTADETLVFSSAMDLSNWIQYDWDNGRA